MSNNLEERVTALEEQMASRTKENQLIQVVLKDLIVLFHSFNEEFETSTVKISKQLVEIVTGMNDLQGRIGEMQTDFELYREAASRRFADIEKKLDNLIYYLDDG